MSGPFTELVPRVLVTRALEDAGPLVQALLGVGLAPVVVPLLERRFVTEGLIRLAADHPRADVVFVTSPAAAEALAIAAPSAWRDASWAAVGPGTERRLRALGYRVSVVPSRATALDLVAALGDLSGQVVVWPRGDLASEETSTGLLGAGASVHDVIAYENVPPRHHAERLLASLPVDATTLLSGSAAERVARALAPDQFEQLGRIVCIGPSTAAVARDGGLPVHSVAAQHTLGGVVEAVRSALGSLTPPPAPHPTSRR